MKTRCSEVFTLLGDGSHDNSDRAMYKEITELRHYHGGAPNREVLFSKASLSGPSFNGADLLP